MNRGSLIVVAVLGLGAAAFADQLPGTLNFSNVTAAKIFQTVPEVASNEKEVEYGDFDNDSDLDVVIAVAYSDFGTRKNKLYINDSTGRFDEISAVVPLFTTGAGDVARNAFFRDYNLDGWLDMIIVCDKNTAGDPGRTKLYMNQHPGGVHTGWTEEGNARLGPSTGGAACGAYSADYDQDGDTELYVGNYPGPSQDTLYRNNGSAFFAPITGTNVPADGDYTVDVSSADMNGDGKLDLLVSNHGPNYLYYNDNNDAGSEVGDFSYLGSVQGLGDAANAENAMEPGDFDNDGDQDIYWSNYGSPGVTIDRIVRNNGNNASNQVMWVFEPTTVLPPSVTSVISGKATVSDLNDDGRVDVFVMKDSATGRPTVLRNTTVGAISFVDWTPAAAFPSGSTHRGWHAAAFDANADDRKDIFLGGWSNDHLFFNIPANEYDESGIVAGDLPLLFNQGSMAVTGTIDPAAPDTYFANDLGANAFVSVIANGPDDYRVEILDSANLVLATVNRGGLGVEEAIQFDPAGSPTTLKFRVTALECATNVSGPCGMSVLDLLDVLGAWGPNPGHPADLNGDNVVDVLDLLGLLGGWGETQYILELLSRSG